MAIQYRCYVTNEILSDTLLECSDCHDRSCPINTGFAEDPIIEEYDEQETSSKNENPL